MLPNRVAGHCIDCGASMQEKMSNFAVAVQDCDSGTDLAEADSDLETNDLDNGV